MSSLKWGIFAGIAAFTISFAVGLLASVSFLVIFLRAIIFFVVFFAGGFGLNLLINNYFPELLMSDEDYSHQEATEGPGSRVNILLDSGEYAVPEMQNSRDGSNEMGNIEDLVSGAFKVSRQGIDRNEEDGYNKQDSEYDSYDREENEDVSEAESAEDTSGKPFFSPDSIGLGGLLDLDTMAMAFGSFGGTTGGSASDSAQAQPGETAAPERNPKGNKPQSMKGDFNPKELAEGIRTVLSKDR